MVHMRHPRADFGLGFQAKSCSPLPSNPTPTFDVPPTHEFSSEEGRMFSGPSLEIHDQNLAVADQNLAVAVAHVFEQVCCPTLARGPRKMLGLSSPSICPPNPMLTSVGLDQVHTESYGGPKGLGVLLWARFPCIRSYVARRPRVLRQVTSSWPSGLLSQPR